MRHPRVNIVTHPANRLVGRDDGYDLDYDALFAAAVDTGTALEIDGGPGHLDMDGRLARRAVAAGVTVTIDSDCHNAARLGRQMRLGVGTARRGGVEARTCSTRGRSTTCWPSSPRSGSGWAPAPDRRGVLSSPIVERTS